MSLVKIVPIYKDSGSIVDNYVLSEAIVSTNRYKKVGIVKDSDNNIYYKTVMPELLEINESSRSYVAKVSEVVTDKQIVSNGDGTFSVKTTEVYSRLDLLAQKLYGDARLYWVIAYANDIMDPMQVPVGTILRVPGLVVVYGSGGVL